MSLVFVVIAVLVIGGVVAYVTGRWGQDGRWGGGAARLDRDHRPDTVDGQPVFDVVLRGYRMDEVDARIAALEQQVSDLRGLPDGSRGRPSQDGA